jgi:hypothetical protein
VRRPALLCLLLAACAREPATLCPAPDEEWLARRVADRLVERIGGGPAATAPEPVAEDVCERAMRCCHAYVEAVAGGSQVDAACAGIAHAVESPMADVACTNMIVTWAQSLQTMGREVPPACTPPADEAP